MVLNKEGTTATGEGRHREFELMKDNSIPEYMEV
jgi:hypothetical protein